VNFVLIGRNRSVLRLCDWPIREESFVYYAQGLVRRTVAIMLRPHWLRSAEKAA